MSKVVVLGTNHAGTFSILEMTKNYPDHEIVSYDKNDNISFLGCGMALWIGKVIGGSDGLFYANPDMLREAGAKINMKHEVLDVDFDKRELTVKNLETGETVVDSYDKLIIAVGSWPILPKLPGHDLDNIMYAKIFQNAQNVIEKMEDKSIKKVCVVGAGYIGVELAEAFKENGKEIVLINDEEVLNRYYDEPFQKAMHDNMVKHGVEIRTGERVTEFKGENGKVTGVVTTKGEYEADLVLMSIGFKPNTDFLKGKGLGMLDNGAIVTNRKMETNIKDVYAVGDCTTVYNNANKQEAHIALATNAVRTGIVAGHNACGGSLEMQGVQGSNAIHIYGLTLCSTGLTEKVAIENGFDVDFVEHTDTLRPGFMPTNADVTIKVVWDKATRRILGAQMMSVEDITLANHFFSLAIQEGLTIDKLALTDLFFLPHFNQPANFITKAGLMALGKL